MIKKDVYKRQLFTTNCLMPPKAIYADRVFTTAVVSYPELTHIGEVSDIANAVMFLASKRSDFTTGDAIKVDGGFSNIDVYKRQL